MELIWQVVIAIVIVLLTALVSLKLYLISIKGKCTSQADLCGKVAIVTGANTGEFNCAYTCIYALCARGEKLIIFF